MHCRSLSNECDPITRMNTYELTLVEGAVRDDE